MPLRVWAEFLPYEKAAEPATVALLRRFDVMLCLSVPHEGLGPPLARLLKAYDDAGLEVALWLLLPKDQGYWPSEANVELFTRHLDDVFAWADREAVRVPWIAVDLELPLSQALAFKDSAGLKRLRVMRRMAFSNLNAARFAWSVERYRALLERIHQHGAKALCAAHDFIIEDLHLGAPIIQDYLETPVYDVPWDVVSTMMYNSMAPMFMGARVEDARWLQYDVGLELKRALGARAGLSVGLTGVGVLGDEPHYHTPQELAPDIAAAKAAGIDDIAIFNLEGILASSDPGAWFQVAVDTPAAVPARTPWAARERWRRRTLARAVGWLRRVPARR